MSRYIDYILHWLRKLHLIHRLLWTSWNTLASFVGANSSLTANLKKVYSNLISDSLLLVLRQDTDQNIITFKNVSFGLEHHRRLHHQCEADGAFRFNKTGNRMGYTPNRRPQNETLQKIGDLRVIIPVAISDPHHPKDIPSLDVWMGSWDSWRKYFLYDEDELPHISDAGMRPSQLTIVLLVDYYMFAEQRAYNYEKDYLDDLLINNMNATPVSCVMLSSAKAPDITVTDLVKCAGRQGRDRSRLQLDQGYYVYFVNRVLIFASIFRFEPAAFALQDIERRRNRSTTSSSSTRDETVIAIDALDDRGVASLGRDTEHWVYHYHKMTNWYVFPVLQLKMLDYFDYLGKVDTDMVFWRYLPLNFLSHMAMYEKKLMTTYRFYDDRGCGKGEGAVRWLEAFIKGEQARCSVDKPPGDSVSNGDDQDMKAKSSRAPSSTHAISSVLTPANTQADNPLYFNNTNHEWKTIYSNFMVAWLGLYSAPEVMKLAHNYHLWEKPRYVERWSDQSWWPHPLVLFEHGNTTDQVAIFYWENWEAKRNNTAMYIQHKPECLVKAPRGSWHALSLNRSYVQNAAMREQNRLSLRCLTGR